MEQKKLLWIAVIVGAFLLIITGTAFLLYGSDNEKTLTAEAPKPNDTVWTPNSNLAISTGTPLVSTDSDTTNLDATAPQPETTEDLNKETETADNVLNNNLSDNVNNNVVVNNNAQTEKETDVKADSEKTLVVDTIKVKNIEANSIDVRNITGTGSNTTNVAKSNQTSKTSTSNKTTVKKPATASEVSTNKTTVSTVNFWIQAGSLTDKLKAEEARKELSEKLITPEIFTREIDSVTYYRLRIGPYKTKQEANYWLEKVQKLKGFEGSYISQTVSK